MILCKIDNYRIRIFTKHLFAADKNHENLFFKLSHLWSVVFPNNFIFKYCVRILIERQEMGIIGAQPRSELSYHFSSYHK